MPSREARALERKVCLMRTFMETPLWKKMGAAILAVALVALLGLAGCAGGQDAADAPAADAPAASAPAPADGDNAAGAADKAASAEDAAATVTVSVTMPEGAEAPSQTTEVSIPQDGTVYDALVATGWDVQADDGDYGQYVTAINGVANGSQGDASGWVFTVNHEQVMEGCGTCKLADGDTVEWTFFV